MALELRSCDVGPWGTHAYALVVRKRMTVC